MSHGAMNVQGPPRLRAVVVTGTDTGVGKTHVAAAILSQLRQDGFRAGAYKPVCSGATRLPDGSTRWDDIGRLAAALDRNALALTPEQLDDAVCPQRFAAAVAPPVAARMEQRTIDRELLATGVELWRGRADVAVIEGVGGWLCPLTDATTFADLASQWRLPVVIVARRGLGTINHTLLTVEAIRNRGVPIAGVVLNEAVPCGDDPSVIDNPIEIERRSGTAVLGEMLHGDHGQLRRAGQPVRIRWSELLGEVSAARGL